ncbi:MAG: hypothetical protein QOJ53_610 [Sphingomonadales bacterium]|nr:hypothetical protein [Sphingomonadales bacterium]
MIALIGAAATMAAAGAGAQPPAQAEPERGTTRTIELAGSFDLARAATDPAYGERLLGSLDMLAAQAPGPPERRTLAATRAAVLAAMRRREESAALIDETLAGAAAAPSDYPMLWQAATMLRDANRALEIIEAAGRRVPAQSRAALFAQLDSSQVWDLVRYAENEGSAALRARLFKTLVEIGWPGDNDLESRDYLRGRLLDIRLDQGNRAAAIALAREISTPGQLLRLLVARRYDSILPDAGDPGRIERALADHDARTQRMLAERPRDGQLLLARARLLTSVGRFEDALALLQPYLGNVAETVAADRQGMWLVEHAAYDLLALGRTDEAIALFARLAAIPITAPPFVDLHNNHASFLWSAGRHREALLGAQALVGAYGSRMNDFGRLWAWSAMACALAGLDRGAEARPWIARMVPLADANEGALMRAYLCLGDMDAAETRLLHRLGGEWPGNAVLALQDWRVAEAPAGPLAAVEARFAQLRARPAIAAALGRVGHVYALPMARTYWGSY